MLRAAALQPKVNTPNPYRSPCIQCPLRREYSCTQLHLLFESWSEPLSFCVHYDPWKQNAVKHTFTLFLMAGPTPIVLRALKEPENRAVCACTYSNSPPHRSTLQGPSKASGAARGPETACGVSFGYSLWYRSEQHANLCCDPGGPVQMSPTIFVHKGY